MTKCATGSSSCRKGRTGQQAEEQRRHNAKLVHERHRPRPGEISCVSPRQYHKHLRPQHNFGACSLFPEFGPSTSAPRSLRVRVGPHRPFSLCRTREGAPNDTHRQYRIRHPVIDNRRTAQPEESQVRSSSAWHPGSASARNCLRHLYLATCGREGNSSTPQPKTR